jgi:predicted transposase/invertase (TIGR01784 family)
MSNENAGNREYKDNVFRLLFGGEDKSAELYNAIKGTNYTPNVLKMNTLQNPLYYGGLRNDVSFTVEDKFVILFEHQSSLSPNMGLRCLLYIADIYKQLIQTNRDDLYKTAPMSIETPEFYVLYNGKAEYPEKDKVKLSDLFKVRGIETNLELIVDVYNVNHGYNKKIMKRSKTLNEYAIFIDKVHDYENNKGFTRTEALNKAVEDCLRANILSEFLQKYGGDIVSILNMEWNMDDALRVRAEEKAEEIAEKLVKRGTPLEFIVEDTGLSLEKVKEIAKKYNNDK